MENLKGSFYNAIDRQFGPGGIPPALIVVGATTAVATGGVLVTTGVADQIIDAITDFIGKHFNVQKFFIVFHYYK